MPPRVPAAPMEPAEVSGRCPDPSPLDRGVYGDFFPYPGGGVSEPRNGVTLGSESASRSGYLGFGPVSAPKWVLRGRKDVGFRIPLTLDPTPRVCDDLGVSSDCAPSPTASASVFSGIE